MTGWAEWGVPARWGRVDDHDGRGWGMGRRSRLRDLVAVRHEHGLVAVLDGGARLRVLDAGDLDLAHRPRGAEADLHGEERVGVDRGHLELHGAARVGRVDHVDAPQQQALARVEAVVAIHLADGGRRVHGDADEHVVQVELRLALVLDVDERLAARDGGPAVDGERHGRLVAALHAPLEDPERAAGGEGARGVLQPQDAARGVEALVDVGVRLELKLLARRVGHQHAQARRLLAVHLQRHRALHLHVLQPAVLVQQHLQLLLHEQVDRLLLRGGRRGGSTGGGGPPRGGVHLHALALRLQRRQQAVARLLGAAQLHALAGPARPRRRRARPLFQRAKAGADVYVVHGALGRAHPRAAAHAAAADAAADGAGKVAQLALALHRLALDLGLLDLHRLLLHDVLGVVDLALDDHLVQLLLVALHVGVLLHLRRRDVLLEAVADDLVEGKEQLKRRARDRLLLQRLHVHRHHLGQQPQRLQVLQDVALLVRHQQQVQPLQRVVHISHSVGLHKGVLLPGAHQFGECREQALDADAAHVHKLAGHQRFAGLCDQRGCEDHHCDGRSSSGLAWRGENGLSASWSPGLARDEQDVERRRE
mmetsp:Transcript_40248/g.104177  ORF Transcript_40248/g.104177 Transcript_40248/m.104177 type:complete len:594 (-) Transcript_40248:31-1812(-)